MSIRTPVILIAVLVALVCGLAAVTVAGHADSSQTTLSHLGGDHDTADIVESASGVGGGGETAQRPHQLAHTVAQRAATAGTGSGVRDAPAQVAPTGGEDASGDPSFLVELAETPITGTEGDDVELTVEIENVGDQADTQTITINVDEFATQTRDVNLSQGQTTTERLNLSTAPGDAGEYNVTVASRNDTAHGVVVVEEPAPATFAVTDMEPRDVELQQGDDLVVAATIRNTGDQEATKQIKYNTTIPATDTQDEQVTLTPEEETTVEFELASRDTADADPGGHQHEVSTPDERLTGDVVIEATEPAAFEIETMEPRDAEILQGDNLEVSVTVRNTGGHKASKRLTYNTTIPEADLHHTNVSLAAGDDTTITFELTGTNTVRAAPGEYQHEVFTPNDSWTGTVDIASAEPPTFEIQQAEPYVGVQRENTIEALQGDEIGIAAVIKNTGDREGRASVRQSLTAPEVADQREQVSLQPNEEQTVRFDPIDTATLAAGKYQFQVTTPNETREVPVSVERVPEPSVEEVVRPERDEYKSTEEYTFLVKYDQETATPIEARMMVDGREKATGVAAQSTSDIPLSASFGPGIHTIQIELENHAGKIATEEFIITVSGQGPIVESYAPEQLTQTVHTGEVIDFSIDYRQGGARHTETIWTVNGEEIARGPDSISYEFAETGTKDVQAAVRIDDGNEAARAWTISADNFEVSPRITEQTTAETVAVDGSREMITMSLSFER